MKTKVKIALLKGGGFIATLAPLGVYVGLNWDSMVTSTSAGWSLTIGGILVAIVVGLQMAGKLGKVMGGAFTAVFVAWGICKLLSPVIMQLEDILFYCMIGQGINKFGVQNLVKYLEEKGQKEEAAKANALQVDRLVEIVESKAKGRS